MAYNYIRRLIYNNYTATNNAKPTLLLITHFNSIEICVKNTTYVQEK